MTCARDVRAIPDTSPKLTMKRGSRLSRTATYPKPIRTTAIVTAMSSPRRPGFTLPRRAGLLRLAVLMRRFCQLLQGLGHATAARRHDCSGCCLGGISRIGDRERPRRDAEHRHVVICVADGRGVREVDSQVARDPAQCKTLVRICIGHC